MAEPEINQETPTPLDASSPPTPRKSPLLKTLFNPETRLGRFNRAALRTLAVILSLFALGLAVGYLALYQPVQRQVSQLQGDLRAAKASNSEMNTNLSVVNQKVESLTRENQALQSSLDQANAHIQVLQFVNQVRAARLALAANDTSGARDTLLGIRNNLIKMAALIDSYKAELSKNLQARFDLALGELDQEPKAANSDLEVLINYLLEVERATFK